MFFPVKVSKAKRTILVLATSPKVPMWGNPEGPYPVSNKTGTSLPSPELLPIFFNLSLKFLASTKGQEFDLSASFCISDLLIFYFL